MCDEFAIDYYSDVRTSGSVAMFGHIMIGMNDIVVMVACYDRVLACVGLERTTPLNDGSGQNLVVDVVG